MKLGFIRHASNVKRKYFISLFICGFGADDTMFFMMNVTIRPGPIIKKIWVFTHKSCIKGRRYRNFVCLCFISCLIKL